MVFATTTATPSGGWQRLRRVPLWIRVLDFVYILWVLRPLVAGVVAGTLLLMVPQSEDLFVQLATGSGYRIIEFLFLLFFVWAAATHYGARMLVNSDARYLLWLSNRPTPYRARLRT